MVCRFMRENQGQYTVREMAGLFGVSCSACYQWAKQQGVSSRREEEDAELARLIREIVEQHHYRYGSPRVRETLRRDYGKRVSRKKVARLIPKELLNNNLRINTSVIPRLCRGTPRV
jgi:ribosome-binding protein aMBF1 (putative translation factor)